MSPFPHHHAIVGGAAAPVATVPIVVDSEPTVQATSGTVHAIDVPAVLAGDLILIFANGAASAAYTMTVPTSYASLWDEANGNLRGRGFRRVAPSDAAATTASVTLSAGQRFSAITLVIRGYDTDVAIADAIAVGTAATGNSDSPNPPSVSPPWGDTVPSLIVPVAHSAAGGSISYPSSYTDGLTAYTGVSNNFHARTSSAEREVEASSEDPGTFGLGGAFLWVAQTVAIKGGIA